MCWNILSQTTQIRQTDRNTPDYPLLGHSLFLSRESPDISSGNLYVAFDPANHPHISLIRNARFFCSGWLGCSPAARPPTAAFHNLWLDSLGVEWCWMIAAPKERLFGGDSVTYMNSHSCKARSCYRNIYTCSWTSCLPAGIPTLSCPSISCPSIFLLMPLISNQKKLAHGGSIHLLSSAPNTRNILDVAGRRWTIHWAGPSSANALVARAACTTFGLVSEVRFALFAGQAACEAPKQGTMKGLWFAYKCTACVALLGTACTGRVEASTKLQQSK